MTFKIYVHSNSYFVDVSQNEVKRAQKASKLKSERICILDKVVDRYILIAYISVIQKQDTKAL